MKKIGFDGNNAPVVVSVPRDTQVLKPVPVAPAPVADNKKWDFTQGRMQSQYPDKLRFTPYAFAKMLYMKDKGTTEVSGFALTDEKDPYLVIDFLVPKQECTGATTEMSADGIVAVFDRVSGPEKFGGMGLSPGRFGRIWIHTHPGFSSTPSGTDWSTFRETFGDKDWAIMFILSDKHLATCILQIDLVPGSYFHIPWEVDWDYEFSGSNFEEWDKEYKDNISARVYTRTYTYNHYDSNSRYANCDECDAWSFLHDHLGKRVCWKCKELYPIDPKFASWDKEDAPPPPAAPLPAISTASLPAVPSSKKEHCDKCGKRAYFFYESSNGQSLCWSCNEGETPQGGFAGEDTSDDLDDLDKPIDVNGFLDEDEDELDGPASIPDSCDHCGKVTDDLIEWEDIWLCEGCFASDEINEWAEEERKRRREDAEDTSAVEVDPSEEDTKTSPILRDPMEPPDTFGRW